MTERIKGMSINDAANIKNTEIAKELCLPPVKVSLFLSPCIIRCVKNSHLSVTAPLLDVG